MRNEEGSERVREGGRREGRGKKGLDRPQHNRRKGGGECRGGHEGTSGGGEGEGEEGDSG